MNCVKRSLSISVLILFLSLFAPAQTTTPEAPTEPAPHIHGNKPTVHRSNNNSAEPTAYVVDGEGDFLRMISPFPVPASDADTADVMQFRQWHSLARSQRGKLASADANISYARFQDAFGQELNKTQSPLITHLLDRVEASVSPSLNRAKEYFHRPRPYQRFQLQDVCGFEHTPPADSSAKYGNSYPSGHTTFGWAVALTLAQVAPDRAQELLLRGREYGESRIVCGVHYPSDVAAASVLVSNIWGLLQSNPEFKNDLRCAREEYTSHRKELSQLSPDCQMQKQKLVN